MATAVVGRIRFVTSMPMNPLLWELNESPAPAREKRRDLSFSSPEKISANNVLIKEGGKKKCHPKYFPFSFTCLQESN